MARLVTEWSTDDPTLTKMLTDLSALSEWTPERQEGEAMLHMMQARYCWADADRLRQRQREQDARDRRREERKQAKASTTEAGGES